MISEELSNLSSKMIADEETRTPDPRITNEYCTPLDPLNKFVFPEIEHELQASHLVGGRSHV